MCVGGGGGGREGVLFSLKSVNVLYALHAG